MVPQRLQKWPLEGRRTRIKEVIKSFRSEDRGSGRVVLYLYFKASNCCVMVFYMTLYKNFLDPQYRSLQLAARRQECSRMREKDPL